MAAPDSRLCRYAIYESGFAAFDIALYSSQLYPEGENLSSQDNAFHAAVSFGLCEDTCAGTDIITRGEAADLLYALLTGEFTVAPPPILETIPLNNKEGVHLNSYLLELQKIPEPIRQAFADCFVYWLTYRDNSKKMAALCSAAPKTYAYLLALESQNWQPDA